MIVVTINDQEFLLKSDISIIDALKHLGINVPKFCYHEMLSVAGNCRMCLVEINDAEKPVASCVTLLQEGMVINTDTPFVKKARENVLEALLVNHPLDCPICDQAGECDLQDQTFSFGSDYSRFFHNKRGVEDKNCGPLIKTIMTRCIHCTRCVRFSSEIAGENFLGTFNRGTSTEIGNYISGFFKSEISGNVIDLCPVGALTAGPYASKARPWELRVNESIDLTDSFGSNIYIHCKESEIVRITPKKNWELNNNIITDKARFSYDFLKKNRIKKLYKKENGKFIEKIWFDFFNEWNSWISSSNTKINVFFDGELNFYIQDMLFRLSNVYPNRINLMSLNNSKNEKNSFNTATLGNVLTASTKTDSTFLFSSNLKTECPILNSRLLDKSKNIFSNLTSFGFFSSTNLPTIFVNLCFNKVARFLEGTSKNSSQSLFNCNNPLFLFGESFNQRLNNSNIIDFVKNLNLSTNCLQLLSKSNSCGIKYFKFDGLVKTRNINIFLNTSHSLRVCRFAEKDSQNIFLNSHGSKFALLCNYIIPIAGKFECEEMFINLEGRAQKTHMILENQSHARSTSNILNAQFFIGKELSKHFNFLTEISKFPNIFNDTKNNLMFIVEKQIPTNTALKYPNKPAFNNFYLQNSMGRNSPIMFSCSAEKKKFFTNFNE